MWVEVFVSIDNRVMEGISLWAEAINELWAFLTYSVNYFNSVRPHYFFHHHSSIPSLTQPIHP